MATLNITFNGLSADYPLELDAQVTDHDLRRIAVEVVRAGGVPDLHIAHLADNAFDGFVVDRLQGGQRIYLRPKVPFGA
jgi:hypothetical protein